VQQINATQTPSCAATRFRGDPVLFAANETRDLHADGTPCLRAGATAPQLSSKEGVMEVQLTPGFDRSMYERHTPRSVQRLDTAQSVAYLAFVAVADGAWMLASYVTLGLSQAALRSDEQAVLALHEVHACFDVMNDGLLAPMLEFIAVQEGRRAAAVTFEMDVELAMDDSSTAAARGWNFRHPNNLGMLILAHAGFRPVQRVAIGDPKERCVLRWMCQVQPQDGGSMSGVLCAGDSLQHSSHTQVESQDMCGACGRHTAELLDRRTRLELLQAIDALCNVCRSSTSLADGSEKVCRKTALRQIQYVDPTDPLRYRPLNAAQLREHVVGVQAGQPSTTAVVLCWTADGHL
jgi:hypothetical protein